MRLTVEEKETIKRVFHHVFGKGKVLLFGSRVDDTRKGGDIDLYLLPAGKMDGAGLFEKKIAFLTEIAMELGERKIDVVLPKDKNRPIEQEALQTGIEL